MNHESCPCCLPSAPAHVASHRPNFKRRCLLTGLAALGASAMLPAALRAADAPVVASAIGGERIDVHHHILPPAYMAALEKIAPNEIKQLQPWWTPAKSIEDMDKNHIDKAVISLTQPQVNFTDAANARRIVRESNDYAAGMVKVYPGRFGMYGVLPLTDTDGSLKEIAYALDTLNADGICLLTSYGDKYLGDVSFAPVYEELNRRKAVVYTHPLSPACCKNPLPQYLRDSAVELGTDTTRTIASLLFSGTAARYPDIKWIFSHAGGTMPYLYGRFLREEASLKGPKTTLPNGMLAEMRKFNYDLAQSTQRGTLQGLLSIIPTSQILLGSDYPARSASEVLAGLLAYGFSPADMDAIEHGNAIRLMPRLGKRVQAQRATLTAA